MAYWLDQKAATAVANQLRAKGNKIVLTHGSFDLFHIGHLAFLKKSKKHGDILFVGVDKDDWVAHFKGQKRPIIPLAHRLQIVAGLEEVAFVFPVGENLKRPSNRYFDELYFRLNPNVVTYGRGFAFKKEVTNRTRSIRGMAHLEIKTPFNTPTTSRIIEKILSTHGLSS